MHRTGFIRMVVKKYPTVFIFLFSVIILSICLFNTNLFTHKKATLKYQYINNETGEYVYKYYYNNKEKYIIRDVPLIVSDNIVQIPIISMVFMAYLYFTVLLTIFLIFRIRDILSEYRNFKVSYYSNKVTMTIDDEGVILYVLFNRIIHKEPPFYYTPSIDLEEKMFECVKNRDNFPMYETNIQKERERTINDILS